MADALIEDQADESGDEAPAPEAEEVEENEYQKDGFVVDDEEADDGDDDKGDDLLNDSSSDDDDDDAPGGGRLRRNKARAAPDAEDLELIAENLGAASKPPADADDSDDDFDDAPKKRPREAAAPEPEAPAAEARLFDDDSDDEPKEKKVKSDALYDEDNFDDFIEDDLGIQQALQREEKMGISRARGPAGAGGGADAPSQLQMMDMIDIFGEDAEDFAAKGFSDDDDEEEKAAGAGFRARYEPGLLAEHYVTDADEAIRKRDLPERLQLRSVATAKRTRRDYETHLEEEAAWIARKLRHPHAPADATVVAVSRLLRFYNEDCYEVPFVAAYRRDYFVDSDIKPAELWRVFELDDEFARLAKRRKDTVKMVKALRAVAPRPFLGPGLAAARLADDGAHRDARHYVKHCFARAGADDGKRRPGQREAAFWAAVRDNDVDKFCRTFAKSAKAVDDALRDPDAAAQMPPTPAEYPDMACLDFLGAPPLDDESKLRECAVAALARDLAALPSVRAEARRAFRELATVTTRPTDKGRAEIDVCHEYHGLQYLQNKKVAEFLDGASSNPPRRHRAGEDAGDAVADLAAADFVKILKAEKEGLLAYELRSTAKPDDPNAADEKWDVDAIANGLFNAYLALPFGGGADLAAPAATYAGLQVVAPAAPAAPADEPPKEEDVKAEDDAAVEDAAPADAPAEPAEPAEIGRAHV